MSVDAVKTVSGSGRNWPPSRPMRHRVHRNILMPIARIYGKRVRCTTPPWDADAEATTQRTAGTRVTAVSITETGRRSLPLECIKRLKVPWESFR